MIEKIIFELLAFTVFIFILANLIRKNDTNYLYILILQFIGITLGFVELIMNKPFNIIIKVLMYIGAIFLPLIVIMIEFKKHINFSEIMCIIVSKIYTLLGREDSAEKYMLKIAKKYPMSKIAHLKLAKLYEKQNKKEKTLEEYQTLLDIIPEDINIYMNVGKLYKEFNRKKEAKQIFIDILKEKENLEASLLLGEILFEEQEYKEAIQIYNLALRNEPANYDLYYNLGMTYTMLNDFKKAKECYEKAAQINSQMYHSKYSIGQLNLIYGELDEAKLNFEESLNSKELEGGSYYYLSRIAVIKGELDNAINYANAAIEDDYKIYEKIQDDNIFAAIRNKIRKPKTSEKPKKELKKAEETVYKHLEETCKLVGKLNNNDLEMIENVIKAKSEKLNLKEREENT